MKKSANQDVDYEIRQANPLDSQGIASLLRAQNIFKHMQNESEEQTAERIRARIESSTPSRDSILVAISGNKICGYGAVRWMPNLILRGIDGYLSELFVHPDSTGRKIGTKILNSFRLEASTRKAERLWCINLRDRESYNRQYYLKSGWEERDIAVFVENQ